MSHLDDIWVDELVQVTSHQSQSFTSHMCGGLDVMHTADVLTPAFKFIQKTPEHRQFP